MTSNVRSGVVGGCLAALVAGCSQQNASTTNNISGPTINQQAFCMVQDWRPAASAKACTPGQKVTFLPESWGNEQLPILFAIGNCDLRYAVALTKGAVACIYLPAKLSEPAEQAKPPQ